MTGSKNNSPVTRVIALTDSTASSSDTDASTTALQATAANAELGPVEIRFAVPKSAYRIAPAAAAYKPCRIGTPAIPAYPSDWARRAQPPPGRQPGRPAAVGDRSSGFSQESEGNGPNLAACLLVLLLRSRSAPSGVRLFLGCQTGALPASGRPAMATGAGPNDLVSVTSQLCSMAGSTSKRSPMTA